MKKMLKRFLHHFAFPLVSAFLLFSCADDIDTSSTTQGLDTAGDESMVINDNNGRSDKDNRKEIASGSGSSSAVIDFGDDFIRGFDASAVDYFENVYASSNSWTDKNWYEADGTKKDLFKLLADHGFNTIRLRVWVDPSETSTITDSVWPTSTTVDGAWRAGDCTIERATNLAIRAKAVGLKVLLDLHLSDYWTDPAVQLIPKSWQTIDSSAQMAEQVSSYVTEALQYMKDEGVTPDFVQVGNEIDRGILVDSSINTSSGSKVATRADSSISGGYRTENFKAYLKAGCQAVRDFDSSIKIIVHITSQNYSRFSYVDASGADYDIVGLSYYPWENHGTIAELKTKIENSSKPVMVVETSASAMEYGGSYSTHMAKAYTNLGGSSIYSDVETSDSAVTSSESNQKKILRHVMQEIYDAGGKGICVWGGERRDYQYGLFSWEGTAYSAIDAFNYAPADGYPSESGSDDDESESEETTMTLTLKFSGFTIPGGSVNVNYGADSGTYEDATGTVNSEGTSATVTLEKTYANSDNWFNNVTVTVKDSSNTEVNVTYTHYFEFDANGCELTLAASVAADDESESEDSNTSGVLYSDSFSGTGSFINVVNSDSMPTSITELYVALENMSGDDWWLQINYDGMSWDIAKATWDNDCSGYSITITDTDMISNFISNGIYAVTGSGISGNLKIIAR